MRLIDADKLYDWVRRECNPYGNPTIDFESGNRMLDMIKRSSTAFDKEKVIDDLENLKNNLIDCNDLCGECVEIECDQCTLEKAIKIVEKGGIE